MQKQHNLSKNQQIILDLIVKSSEPLKAYSILFNVQKKGINAPLQVYRALDKLVELGRIHKIESKNSFIVCSNSNCASNTIFTICERCDKVKELKNNNLAAGMSELIKKNGQSITRYNLEFFVLCKSCKSN
jgi:Fur family zinc uptake transcriptional regulator